MSSPSSLRRLLSGPGAKPQLPPLEDPGSSPCLWGIRPWPLSPGTAPAPSTLWSGRSAAPSLHVSHGLSSRESSCVRYTDKRVRSWAGLSTPEGRVFPDRWGCVWSRDLCCSRGLLVSRRWFGEVLQGVCRGCDWPGWALLRPDLVQVPPPPTASPARSSPESALAPVPPPTRLGRWERPVGVSLYPTLGREPWGQGPVRPPSPAL